MLSTTVDKFLEFLEQLRRLGDAHVHIGNYSGRKGFSFATLDGATILRLFLHSCSRCQTPALACESRSSLLFFLITLMKSWFGICVIVRTWQKHSWSRAINIAALRSEGNFSEQVLQYVHCSGHHAWWEQCPLMCGLCMLCGSRFLQLHTRCYWCFRYLSNAVLLRSC